MSSSIESELMVLFQANEEGLSNDNLKTHFGQRYSELVPILNDWTSKGRLQILKNKDTGILVFQIVSVETAAKLTGLGPDQVKVYQACERAGNRGIWTRDIKTETSLTQQAITKALKFLETRMLIKSVRSVVSKTKKLYMLFDMVPGKELTGGPWYTDQEFDEDFVLLLSKFIVNVVKEKQIADINAINAEVKNSGISKVELSLEDLEMVIQTLVYDGLLEEVPITVLNQTNRMTGNTSYKMSKTRKAPNYLTDAPCGVCPVIARCCEGGVISPSNCVYFSEWLDMPVGATMEW